MTDGQQLIFGRGTIGDVPSLVAKFGQRIALFAGSTSFEVSGAAVALRPLTERCDVLLVRGFRENPYLSDVTSAAEAVRTHRPDVILAVGGGTVIDVAKCAAALALHPGNPLDVIRGQETIGRTAAPLIAVPTTASSGSEATHFAVVYDEHRKYSLAHPDLKPVIAVVDPDLTLTTAPSVATAGALDILAHGTESYWANSASATSQRLSREAIALARPALTALLSNPTIDTRIDLSRAAYIAGCAINLTKTTAAHALSYGLTSRFGIRHGHAVALMLGPIAKANAQVSKDDVRHPAGADYVHQCLADLATMWGVNDAAAIAAQISDLLAAAALPQSLSEAEIPAEAVDLLVADVNLERLSNNPRSLSGDQIRTMYRAMWR